MESKGSEKVTDNKNSESVTDHADHTKEHAELTQLKVMHKTQDAIDSNIQAASMKRTGHLSRITTPNQRTYSNIVKKPVHPDPRGNSSTVQKKKIQPHQKVPRNKTTIQKPGKEKQREDDKYNSKLRLAMKTWLEQTRSSK